MYSDLGTLMEIVEVRAACALIVISCMVKYIKAFTSKGDGSNESRCSKGTVVTLNFVQINSLSDRQKKEANTDFSIKKCLE